MSDTLAPNDIKADLAKINKVGRGKRDLILVAALVVVAAVIVAVGFGFRGNHVSRSAEAMVVPVPVAASQTAARATKP